MRSRDLIVLVEDDDTDAFIAKTLLEKCRPGLPIERLSHGLEAQRFLDELEGVPSLIILDLNMPFLNGRDFLKNLREDVKRRDTEVVVLSSSENKDDKSRCEELGVKYYFTKPLTLETAGKIIKLAEASYRN
jgi:CheY-like chemotaxis protein